jgi:hypothetical protein
MGHDTTALAKVLQPPKHLAASYILALFVKELPTALLSILAPAIAKIVRVLLG